MKLIVLIMLITCNLFAEDCEKEFITKNIAKGEYLKLSDGNLYYVSWDDRLDSMFWSIGDDVMVCDFYIVNLENKEKVYAMRFK